MPGCGMHSRPKLAEKARYNSLLKIKQTTTRQNKSYCQVLLSNIIDHSIFCINKQKNYPLNNNVFCLLANEDSPCFNTEHLGSIIKQASKNKSYCQILC